MTQRELASYLGLDPAQLSKWEKGHRGLPYEAGAKWSDLQLSLNSVPVAPPEAIAGIVAPQQAALSEFMDQQLIKCGRKPHLQQRLDEMQAAYQQCLDTLAFVARLRASGMELEHRQELALNCAEARTKKQIWDCGLVKQAELSIQLQALTATEQELQTINNNF